MQCNRKGWNDTIKLRLSLSGKSDEELLGMYAARDPADTRRFSHDAKTRKAIDAVLVARRVLSPPLTEGSET